MLFYLQLAAHGLEARRVADGGGLGLPGAGMISVKLIDVDCAVTAHNNSFGLGHTFFNSACMEFWYIYASFSLHPFVCCSAVKPFFCLFSQLPLVSNLSTSGRPDVNP